MKNWIFHRKESSPIRALCHRWFLLPLVSLLAGCGQPSVEPVGEWPDPYRIVATTGMVGDLARRVAGDRATVRILVGEGVDPHLFMPTRSDVAALLSAHVVFYNGLMLEGKMAETLARIGKDERPVIAVAEKIDARVRLEEEPGQHDPHLWMDVGLWSQALDVVVESLSALDPAHAAHYAEQGAEARAEFAELDDYVRRVIASIPESSRILVTAHDAFQYFGRAYDIEVVGIQGISTESEAGLEDINRLVDLLVQRQIPAVFVESSVADKNVRALIEGARARGHAVRIGGTLFSDAMGAAGTYEGTYVGMLDHNATVIARALGGEAPAHGWRGRLRGGPHALD